MARNRVKEVEELAYKLYEKNGCAGGKDLEHWYEAERMLGAEKQVGTKKPVAKVAKKTKKKAPAGVKAKGAKVRRKSGAKAAKKRPATTV